MTAHVRHAWQRKDAYNATCTRCGTHAQRRPSPYGRRWFTEWRLPDGTYVNNYDGEPIPPCQPVADKPAADSGTSHAAGLLEAALALGARGWHVFPLRPRDKRPMPRFTDWETHATTDPARIRAAWSRGPAYNIAIACGPSGLVVIDLDTPKPGETPPPEWAIPGVNDGADVLAVLAERHGQPFPTDTFTVTTRRGGTHLYFTAPPGSRLRNTSGRYRTGLGWLIDTRANGGYVVAPGSVVDLPDGAGAYRVANPAPPAPLPAWLTRLLTTPPAPTSLGAPTEAGGVADLPAYVQAALKGEAVRVTDAVPGGRNHALNKAAYNLGRLVGANLLPEETAREVLWEAVAVHLGPDRTADIHPADARATIRSALAAGARNPRTITRRDAA